jgi:hypothetical protein
MNLRFSALRIGLVLFGILGWAGQSLAQSDPAPLLLPFDKNQNLELGGTDTIFSQGQLKGDDTPFQLRQYESEGRFRFTDVYPVNPAVGYNALFLDLDTPSEAVPRNLTDLSIGFASPLKQFDNGWYIVAGVGAGYAGEQLFNYSGSLYGKATFIVGKEFNERYSILAALSYDGNRLLYPDIPIPAVALTINMRPQFQMALGFPYTTFTYKPNDKIKVELTARIGTASLTGAYNITKQLRLFGSFDSIGRAFRLKELHRDDRLFFQQRRLEAGVLFRPIKEIGITVAGGYGFAQEFTTGFDDRDTHLVYKPSDEGYVRFGLVWKP